jgi:hypothetical protein
MTTTTETAAVWAPRLAAIALSLFLALFALDAFTGKSFAEGLADFTIHLAPSLIVLAVAVLAWRHPLAGAVAFALFALGYAVMVRGRLDWIALISGPLALVAVLYFVSWRLASSSQIR